MTRDQRRRFSAGDTGALREVYRQYAGAVYGLSYRVLRDHGLAEEATQSAFVNAWRGAGSYDPARDLGPWLFTIARRAAIDIYRREQRHRAAAPLDTEIAVLPVSLDDTWRAWQVQEALRELPDAEREVLRCTHFLGLTHEETAQRLNIPVGTVKSRGHRAHRKLAGMLAHLEEASA